MSQYLKKGSSLFVEGRIQTRSWDSEKGKQYRTEIIADRFQFGPRAGGAAPGGFGGGSSAGASAGPAKETPTKSSDEGIAYPEEDINPDDIPF